MAGRMASETAEAAVRSYLDAVRDPSSLRDDDAIEKLRSQLDEAGDAVERVRLRQQLMDAEQPSVERHEEAFVTHARAWADEHGVTAKAFADEGVAPEVLRRAGFDVPGGRGRGRGAAGRAQAGRPRRTRVSAEEVRSAIGQAAGSEGTFTIKQLQEVSGASPAVVRRVVAEEEQAGRVANTGTDPDHRGPGRAPVLYRRT